MAFPQITNVMPVDTNIIVFDVADNAPTATEIVDRMKDRGVLLGAFGERRLRIVTCLNVDKNAVDALVTELASVLSD